MKVDARSFVGDNSTFADDEGSRYARTCGIVLDGETGVNVFAVTPESRQGRHNHSVLESDGANLDGLEKLECGHCKASEYFRNLLIDVVPV